MTHNVRLEWHIFCEVIDNYGDIGVCWRLAKQLQQHHQQQVHLWVDDLASFQALCADLDPQQSVQQIQGICIYHWQPLLPAQGLHALASAQVVIEAFGCRLPDAVLESMRQQSHQPLWLNVEYLSAEDWVAEAHGLPSPVQGMQKYFFFPGFVASTGGLLWEPELLTLPATMQQTTARAALFTQLGLAAELAQHELHISLFAYENPQVQSLLQCASEYSHRVHVLVPQGRISDEVAQWLGEPLEVGRSYQRAALTLSALPFMPQDTYDQVLASCQLNLVRGEESFVRAQMLGLPFIWHIYPQQEDAHWVKLDAFLQRYNEQAAAPLAELIQAGFLGWNQAAGVLPWEALWDQLLPWQQHAQAWQQRLQQLGNLAENLVEFAQTRYSAAILK